MVREVRRVVTGANSEGKSVVTYDGPSTNTLLPPNRPGLKIHHLWHTTGTSEDLSGKDDGGTGPITLQPPPQGTFLRIVEFPPEKEWLHLVDAAKTQAGYAALGAKTIASGSQAAHPLMHRTETVDYAVMLEGECYLVLDDSEVLIHAGDVVIQRGANHAWSNRSDRSCRIAFVLIDARHT